MAGRRKIKKHDKNPYAIAVLAVGMIFGLLFIATSKLYHDYFDIKAIVISFPLFFLSLMASVTGWYGVFPREDMGRHLKNIEIIWVSLSAVALLFSLLQPLIDDAGSKWEIFLSNVASQREIIQSSLHSAMNENCPNFNFMTSPQNDVCYAIFRAGNRMNDAQYVPYDVWMIAENRTLHISDRDSLIHAIDYTVDTMELYNSSLYKIYVDSGKVMSHLWKLFLLIAVSFKFSKAIIERYWLPSPQATIRANQRDQTSPAADPTPQERHPSDQPVAGCAAGDHQGWPR